LPMSSGHCRGTAKCSSPCKESRQTAPRSHDRGAVWRSIGSETVRSARRDDAMDIEGESVEITTTMSRASTTSARLCPPPTPLNSGRPAVTSGRQHSDLSTRCHRMSHIRYPSHLDRRNARNARTSASRFSRLTSPHTKLAQSRFPLHALRTHRLFNSIREHPWAPSTSVP